MITLILTGLGIIFGTIFVMYSLMQFFGLIYIKINNLTVTSDNKIYIENISRNRIAKGFEVFLIIFFIVLILFIALSLGSMITSTPLSLSFF